MPNSPYAPRALNPPPDPELWRQYQRANRAAANQYAVIPIAFRHAQIEQLGVVRNCLHCPRKTRSSDGQCIKCKRAVVGE